MGQPTDEEHGVQALMAALETAPDLDQVVRMAARESVIREVMADTGESRPIVIGMLDAIDSMAQEAVTDLVEGSPTTLADALRKYVVGLVDVAQPGPEEIDDTETRTGVLVRREVAGELDALLTYPWPGAKQRLEIRDDPGPRRTEVWVDGQQVASANYDEHGWSGLELAATVATAVAEAIAPSPEKTGGITDGYHTFDELYAHRRALTAALGASCGWAWRSKAHHPEDSPIYPGYFIVGLPLPTGTVTYHYPLEHWDDFDAFPVHQHADKWDGASPADSVTRLLEWANRG